MYKLLINDTPTKWSMPDRKKLQELVKVYKKQDKAFSNKVIYKIIQVNEIMTGKQ